MNSLNPVNERSNLKPLLVWLSCLHLNPPISTLHLQSGVDVFLSTPADSVPVPFKVIISESTSENLLLRSFFQANAANRPLVGRYQYRYQVLPLHTEGISRCLFTTKLAQINGILDHVNDWTSPQFQVHGVTNMPLKYQDHYFSPRFLVCEHIFSREEFEGQFVAVLGLHFLNHTFIRAKLTSGGWSFQLPAFPRFCTNELMVYVDGLFLEDENGIDSSNPRPRGGYGIHFPSLPPGWDVCSGLAKNKKYTKKTLDLGVIMRALQLIRMRSIQCGKVNVVTHSDYAVKAFNERVVHCQDQRQLTSNDHLFVHPLVVNALKLEISLLQKVNIAVEVSQGTPASNGKARTLSMLGAQLQNSPPTTSRHCFRLSGPNSRDSRMVLGRSAMIESHPVAQGTPDGLYFGKLPPIGNESWPQQYNSI